MIVNKYLHTYSLLFFLISLLSFSQNDTVKYEKEPIEILQFDQKKLEDFKNDKAFDYKVKEPKVTWVDKLLNWLKKWLMRLLEWLFGTSKAGKIIQFIVAALPYLIGLIALFLIYKLFGRIHTNSIVAKDIKVSQVPIDEAQLIKSPQDLKALIKEALANKDFRLALRYDYLQLLHELEQHEIILWEEQKTNQDYENEIQDKSLKTAFKDITYLYDFVWYGNFSIDEKRYDKANTRFNAIKNSLK